MVWEKASVRCASVITVRASGDGRVSGVFSKTMVVSVLSFIRPLMMRLRAVASRSAASSSRSVRRSS